MGSSAHVGATKLAGNFEDTDGSQLYRAEPHPAEEPLPPCVEGRVRLRMEDLAARADKWTLMLDTTLESWIIWEQGKEENSPPMRA